MKDDTLVVGAAIMTMACPTPALRCLRVIRWRPHIGLDKVGCPDNCELGKLTAEDDISNKGGVLGFGDDVGIDGDIIVASSGVYPYYHINTGRAWVFVRDKHSVASG